MKDEAAFYTSFVALRKSSPVTYTKAVQFCRNGGRMKRIGRIATGCAALLGAFSFLAMPNFAAAGAAAPGDVVRIEDKAVVPENIAATRDGTVLIASYGRGTIYRAAPGAAVAHPWISGAAQGMARSMGLWADEGRRLLWVCAPGARGSETAPAGTSFVRTFDLRTGAPRAAYPLADGGSCNDVTLAADGTLYASDMAGRIFRRKPGEAALQAWAESPHLAGADGLALLDDGQLYVNSYRSGKLFRIAVGRGGAAGAIAELALDRGLENPDGMRRAGPDRLLLAEGAGRLTEVTVRGDTAQVRVVRDGLADSPTGVAVTGGRAYVSQANWGALRSPDSDRGVFTVTIIPYPPRRP